jgi:hypothetical protein
MKQVLIQILGYATALDLAQSTAFQTLAPEYW